MAIEKEDLAALKPDALAPAEVEAKAEALAETKACMPAGRMFVAAMLAGAFVAFGGMYFCVFLSDPTMPYAAQRVVGGLCFCLGLELVLCCGAELFTGNSLMACGLASKRIGVAPMLRNWVIVWLGNLVGSLFAVALLFFADIPGGNGGLIGEAVVNLAAGKVSLELPAMFFKAILCNIFVCLAVWIGFSARSVTDKVIGILLPISAFVACGFEHCVANMFFLPMGLLLNVTGVGAADAVTLFGVAQNIGVVTLGNIVGGVLVGMAYWYAYRKRAAK